MDYGIEIIDNTEEDIKTFHDNGWGSSEWFITKDQAQEFLNGKLIAIFDGEYTTIIGLIDEKRAEKLAKINELKEQREHINRLLKELEEENE